MLTVYIFYPQTPHQSHEDQETWTLHENAGTVKCVAYLNTEKSD